MRVEKYTKRPVPVSAIKLTRESCYQVQAYLTNNGGEYELDPDGMYIATLEGMMFCPWGSYVVMGHTHREFWCVRGDIFEETYERVLDYN